jgi:hypothetical protein
MDSSSKVRSLITIIAVPCLSFGPLFFVMGNQTGKSPLDTGILMLGALMLSAGLLAILILLLKIDKQISARKGEMNTEEK